MSNYINSGIVGDSITTGSKRGFRAVPKASIEKPNYDAKFFETFPTVWAAAYAFSRELTDKQTDGNTQLSPAMEEWVSLFLLHYVGAVHLETIGLEELKNNKLYDKDLWLALSGTYPAAGNGIAPFDGLHLLRTENRTTVGAYYPEVVFFPARGRARWSGDDKLRPYLERNRLSWQLCSAAFLTTPSDREQFMNHLLLVARRSPTNDNLRRRLRGFAATRLAGNNFNLETWQSEYDIEAHPTTWKHMPYIGRRQPDRLLGEYPLRKPKPDGSGGFIYYLVNDMKAEAWMAQINPSPAQFVKTNESQITVNHAGKQIVCTLKPEDEIVELKSLFLEKSPAWCAAPTDTHASLINSVLPSQSG